MKSQRPILPNPSDGHALPNRCLTAQGLGVEQLKQEQITAIEHAMTNELGAKPTGALAWVCACLLILAAVTAGAVLLAAGLLDPATLKRFADAGSRDGVASSLTIEVLRPLQQRSLSFGLAYMGIGIAAAVAHRKLARALSTTISETLGFARSAWHETASFFRRETAHGVLLVFVFLIGIGLRVLFLNAPMRTDEGSNFLRTWDRHPVRALSDYYSPNNHLLNTALMHASARVFGVHDWSIRVPALVFGSLLVPSIYLVVRQLSDRSSAMAAAALVAGWPCLILCSVNARGYSCVLLCFVLLLALTWSLLQRPTYAAVVTFAVTAAAGFYAVPVMLYPFGIVIVWAIILIFRDRSSARRSSAPAMLAAIGLTGIFTLVPYTPVFIVSGPAAIAANRYVLPRAWLDLPQMIIFRVQDVWQEFHLGIPLWTALLMAGCAVAAVFLNRRSSALRRLVLAACTAMLIFLLVQRVVPPTRCVLPLLLLYVILVAVGITSGWQSLAAHWRGAKHLPAITPALILALALATWTAYKASPRPAYEPESAARFLKTVLREGDSVIMISWHVGYVDFYLRDERGRPLFRESDPQRAERVWVVVDDTRHGLSQTLEVLGYAAASSRLVKALPTASVYVCRGLEPTGGGHLQMRAGKSLQGSRPATGMITASDASHPSQ